MRDLRNSTKAKMEQAKSRGGGGRTPSQNAVPKIDGKLPNPFFQGATQWNPTTEQTKTLLKENFTANSRLCEYIDPDQNLKKNKAGGANRANNASGKIEGRFDSAWQLRDSIKRNNIEISDNYSDFPEFVDTRPDSK